MIHIFKEQDGQWSVWTDCEAGEHKLGRCLAIGEDKQTVLAQAVKELESDIEMIQDGRAPEIIE